MAPPLEIVCLHCPARFGSEQGQKIGVSEGGHLLQGQPMALFAFLAMLPSALGAVHTGFLYDKLCVDRGVGIDGVDTRTEPERHSVHCLLVSVCRNSGYGILTKPSGQSQYSMEILLSERGNSDVITWLGTQEYWGRDVQVEISGPLDSQGRLHVDTIKRLNSGTVWNGSGAGAAMSETTSVTTTEMTTSTTTTAPGQEPSSTTPGTTPAPSTSTTAATSTRTPGVTSTTPGVTAAGSGNAAQDPPDVTTSAAQSLYLISAPLALFFAWL